MCTKTIFKYGSSENYAISRPFWFRLQLLQNYYTTHSVNLFEKLLIKGANFRLLGIVFRLTETKKLSTFYHLAAIIIANCVGLELTNSLPCFTMNSWARVNVTYTDVYMVENMAAVKYRRTRKFTCLVLNVLIILYNIIYDKENSKLDERNR